MAKTVNVLVAVAVNSSGEWNAAGWDGLTRERTSLEALDPLESYENGGERRVYFLKAILPVPETAPKHEDIAATVEDA